MSEVQLFDEKKLREEIVKVWGPAGAHVDVFDTLILRRETMLAVVEAARDFERGIKPIENRAMGEDSETRLSRLRHALRGVQKPDRK